MGGKFRKIKPKDGFYTPKEMEDFNRRNNNFTGTMKRPGKLEGGLKSVKRFNIHV